MFPSLFCILHVKWLSKLPPCGINNVYFMSGKNLSPYLPHNAAYHIPLPAECLFECNHTTEDVVNKPGPTL